MNPNVVCIIAPLYAKIDSTNQTGILIVQKPADFFYFLHNLALHQKVGLPEMFVKGAIADSARIARSCIIGKHVEIGDNVMIDEGCIIFDNTIICNDVVIGPRCLIGVDGFFSKRILAHKKHVKHFGGVRIGQNCRLHSDITISRSANYSEFSKIESEVHIGHKSVIGHDCQIGKGSDISVNALIAGRVRIGRNCWIGASASVSNECVIGDNSKIRIGAVVVSDINNDEEVSGNFAIPHHKNLRRFMKEK